VVLATKATMRSTVSPGALDSDQHAFAVRTELGPQAESIRSPEFRQRLGAARHR
jgi:enoyl-CoA hydratase